MMSATGAMANELEDMVHQTTIAMLAAITAKSLIGGDRLRTDQRWTIVAGSLEINELVIGVEVAWFDAIARARSLMRSTASPSMGCESVASMATSRSESWCSSSQSEGILFMTILPGILYLECLQVDLGLCIARSKPTPA